MDPRSLPASVYEVVVVGGGGGVGVGVVGVVGVVVGGRVFHQKFDGSAHDVM